MCGWAQLLEDENLSNATSFTAKQFGTDCRLPNPFLLELVNLLKVTSLYHPSPEKTQKLCIFDPTDDKEGSDSQSSRKNNRSETGFFIPSFRLQRNWPWVLSEQNRKAKSKIDFSSISIKISRGVQTESKSENINPGEKRRRAQPTRAVRNCAHLPTLERSATQTHNISRQTRPQFDSGTLLGLPWR